MKSITELFNDKINGIISFNAQDRKEYLIEREGIYIHDAGFIQIRERREGMIEKLLKRLKQSNSVGIFHDSRNDVRLLRIEINRLIDKINELVQIANQEPQS